MTPLVVLFPCENSISKVVKADTLSFAKQERKRGAFKAGSAQICIFFYDLHTQI